MKQTTKKPRPKHNGRVTEKPASPQAIEYPEIPNPGKATIGFITGGTPRIEFMLSMLATLKCDRDQGWDRFDHDGFYTASRSGANVWAARNQLASRFLGTGAEWFVMIDDDMEWEPDTVETLIRWAEAQDGDKPIMGGLCFAYVNDPETNETVIRPTLFDCDENGKATPWTMDRLPAEPTMVQVDLTGAAFLVVHRNALLKMAMANPNTKFPWFREAIAPGDTRISEDFFFCMAAQNVEIPVIVYTGTHIGHVKEIKLNRALAESDHSALATA